MIITIPPRLFDTLLMSQLKCHRINERRKCSRKNTKVLGPLVTKQDFGGDLDLDEYDNSIDKS